MKSHVAFGVALVLVCATLPMLARADLNDLIPSLVNPIEIAAARANQAVYDSLTTPQGPAQRATCDPSLLVDPGEGACSGRVFRVFDNVRHLVHNANELTGSGPTDFSLHLDRRRLGNALRWTAAEELAAQGTAVTRFSGNQLNSLANRLSALRIGARGFKVAQSSEDSQERFATLGGGASADNDTFVKRWGGFIDASGGSGRQDDTTNLATPGSEDAFDYDGLDITGGLDYRVGSEAVIGAIVGYTRRAIDFDSSVSIVDGTIDSNGTSALLYVMWEHDAFYVSASLGTQTLDHDLVRRIAYPSFNPLIPAIDETARSATQSDSLLASVNVGYTWRRGAFSVEPYLRGEWQDIDIDGFSERDADGFELRYGAQSIESLDVAVGMKLHYVFTPSFGVVVPFVRAELHRELSDERRTIDATYAGVVEALGAQGAQNFDLHTNAPDERFYTAMVGASCVLKHGLQLFVQYERTFALEHIDDRAIAGGVRLEF